MALNFSRIARGRDWRGTSEKLPVPDAPIAEIGRVRQLDALASGKTLRVGKDTVGKDRLAIESEFCPDDRVVRPDASASFPMPLHPARYFRIPGVVPTT